MQTDVLIVGGGLAGLACAVGLERSGLGVLLLEASERLGGRAQSWVDRTTGDTIDIGPHILLTEYPNLLRLLEMLGTRERLAWQTDELITLLDARGRTRMRTWALPPPLHLAPSLLRARSVRLRDKLSNARLTWLAMHLDERDVASLDGIDAYRFLRRMGVSGRFIDWFWASVAMTLLNVPLERCSAGALMRVYRQLIGHRDVHIGFATAGLAELFAPHCARRIEAAGGRILLQAPAASLVIDAGRVSGARLANGTRIAARVCVAAVPPQTLAALLPAGAAHGAGGLAAAAAQFEPSPYVSTYLWFDRKLTHARFWTRVWSPRTLTYDSYDLSNIRAGWAARPSVIASNIIYSHRAHGLTDAQIVAAVARELAEFAPAARRARILHAVVNRIPMAIPLPLPGSERRRPGTAAPLDGLLLAGDWTRTGLPASMESAVRSG